MLVDSHCHLDFPELAADLPGVLSRMGDNGVSHALTISTTLETFPAVRQVAHSAGNLWCSAGVHPDERRDSREATLDDLLAMAADPKLSDIPWLTRQIQIASDIAKNVKTPRHRSIKALAKAMAVAAE